MHCAPDKWGHTQKKLESANDLYLENLNTKNKLVDFEFKSHVPKFLYTCVPVHFRLFDQVRSFFIFSNFHMVQQSKIHWYKGTWEFGYRGSEVQTTKSPDPLGWNIPLFHVVKEVGPQILVFLRGRLFGAKPDGCQDHWKFYSSSLAYQFMCPVINALVGQGTPYLLPMATLEILSHEVQKISCKYVLWSYKITFGCMNFFTNERAIKERGEWKIIILLPNHTIFCTLGWGQCHF